MNSTLLLALLATASGVVDEGTETVALEDRALRTFDLVLPTEPWRPVAGALPIAHAGGSGFAVEPAGTGLKIDTDGDGTPERLVEGAWLERSAIVLCDLLDERTGERHAWVRLEGERPEGGGLVYAVRLLERGNGWEWAPSGVVQGKLGKLRVQVVDLSGNGRFDDYGEDALVVGSGDFATLLSRTILVAGDLKGLRVAADGTSLEVSPYEGATGLLDVTSELDTEGRLLSAVFVDTEDPSRAYDLAAAAGPARVPAGSYRLVSGVIGLLDARVRVRQGRSKPLEDAVRAYGAAGEEYYGWTPCGKSPEFLVEDREDGVELAKALFAGST